jgi:hypothetical protein
MTGSTTEIADGLEGIRSKLISGSTLCDILSKELIAAASSTASTSTSKKESSIELIRLDYLTLTQAIGKECTSFSLASKPPISISAAQSILNNLVDNYLSKLSTCLNASPSPQTAALAKEIKSVGL